MLHILNGSSTEETLRGSTITGELFSFRDALISGPATRTLDESIWRRTRAEHLSKSYGVNYDECERDLYKQSETLRSFKNHDEIVLWFEHDLFCQLNLLYLLDFFGRCELSSKRLSLINIGSFPGRENFRGLGELNVEDLASLFSERQRVTEAQLQLAQSGWQSFSSTDPREIEELLLTDTSELPFLGTALESHLYRFPTTRNGLGRIENKSLELIESGCDRFKDLFLQFATAEKVYGFGDAQLWSNLKTLSSARVPIITISSGDFREAMFAETTFQLTQAGKSVFEGETDFLQLNAIDEWLGGVHLQDKPPVWRWDEQSSRLKYC
jgi:Domain of unknown function (DUF1835)